MIMESKTKTRRLTKTNGGSSSRFLHCFKPPEMDINDRGCVPVRPVRGCTDGFSHHERVFTYVDVAEKPGVVFTRISDDVDVGVGGNKQDQNGVVEKKKIGGSRGGRKLLRMMRAVMFETSLAKKIRKKKHKHKQWQSDKNGNPLQQEYSEDENGRTISRKSSSSGYSSAITSSSAGSSSLSSNARQRDSDRINSFQSNNSLDGKQKRDMSFLHNQERRKGCYGRINMGCCFLVISLFVLVFWGRVCAIVCTSTWLVFVPQRWRSSIINVSSSKNGGDYTNAKLHFEKYKKKIITERLLERNHSRGL
ncbi:hypothetical protein Dsin_022709 [Dipteronia sinensis]|uniref:Transmembrane protein n=1 Tax=Dipteronia sinensis TaxID=43782 RepID=A0AAE0A250_9ROSI|nr:hypothetical protein Dsin_022709 [Dipteronia sinensis]